MNDFQVFRPPRRNGLIFHGVTVLVLGAAGGLVFASALRQPAGGFLVLLLLLALLLLAPLPWVIYRGLALTRAGYRLERDGLRLRWGLRGEDIPLPDIEWVRRPADLAAQLPLPRLRWPGALLGSVQVADLGPVEFMASGTENLLLIATPQRIYAISPENPNAFLRAYQETLEMGSLTPISSSSVLPAAYLSQVWANPLARGLLITGFLLNLVLFIAAGLIIPGRASTSPSGIPAAQLILLPILGALIYIVDLLTGLFFYRREEYSVIAYIVWISAVVTAGLLLIGLILLLLSAR